MASFTYRSSRPDRWAVPRAYTDPSLRRKHYGPIQPMLVERQGFLAKLLRAG